MKTGVRRPAPFELADELGWALGSSRGKSHASYVREPGGARLEGRFVCPLAVRGLRRDACGPRKERN